MEEKLIDKRWTELLEKIEKEVVAITKRLDTIEESVETNDGTQIMQIGKYSGRSFFWICTNAWQYIKYFKSKGDVENGPIFDLLKYADEEFKNN